MQWQVQEAKQRFSELLRRALEEGPQSVTKHGQEVAIVMDVAHYRELTGHTVELSDYLLHGPKDDAFAELLDTVRAPSDDDQRSAVDDLVSDLTDASS